MSLMSKVVKISVLHKVKQYFDYFIHIKLKFRSIYILQRTARDVYEVIFQTSTYIL